MTTLPQPHPQQSAAYLGAITDTSRWQNFKHRADDIFICTPPKCGTTWTQAICAMLVSGKVDHGTQPGLVSPWVDANFVPVEDYLKQVDAQTHRRYMKTHTPFDGIPYFPEPLPFHLQLLIAGISSHPPHHNHNLALLRQDRNV